jgi:hypothetical protein
MLSKIATRSNIYRHASNNKHRVSLSLTQLSNTYLTQLLEYLWSPLPPPPSDNPLEDGFPNHDTPPTVPSPYAPAHSVTADYL